MARAAKRSPRVKGQSSLQKVPTGIAGFDEIVFGGLPKGRPTLVAGDAGCGKTFFAMEFLVRGAQQFDEPGVMVSFEETSQDLIKNFSLSEIAISSLIAKKKLIFEYMSIDRSEIEETGLYDLEGLFVRLDYAIKSIGAKRIVLDTIEALFGGLQNEMIVRSELRRLFRWLKERGITAIITGEQGIDTITRHGLEEFVADCVLVLTHNVVNRVATRRMRVVKYRGSTHGADEIPFLIGGNGISVFPVSSLVLEHKASRERISSGVPDLDAMIGGKGFYRGASILVTGTAGTGKTTLAAQFAEAACKRKERVVYFSFEESEDQIARNMESVGINLAHHIKAGLLKMHASRPTTCGLEMHLAIMHQIINETKPTVVIIDPISNLVSAGTMSEVMAMLIRLLDYIKVRQITAMFTDLSEIGFSESTGVGVSSLMDAWILLRTFEVNGERNRGLYVLKTRGLHNSNQVREFILTSNGVRLVDVYTGTEGMLTGTARITQTAKDRAALSQRDWEREQKDRELKRRSVMFEAEMTLLKLKYEAEEEQLHKAIAKDISQEAAVVTARQDVADARGVKRGNTGKDSRKKR